MDAGTNVALVVSIRKKTNSLIMKRLLYYGPFKYGKKLEEFFSVSYMGEDQKTSDSFLDTQKKSDLEGLDAVVYYENSTNIEAIAQTWALRSFLNSLSLPPQVFVLISSIQYYASKGDEVLYESSRLGTDKLAQFYYFYEKAIESLESRVVILRKGAFIHRFNVSNRLMKQNKYQYLRFF